MPGYSQSETFVSWGVGRKIALGCVVAIYFLLLCIVNLPFGLDTYLLLLTCSFIWNEPGNVVGKRSDYDSRVWSYKWAMFCVAFKNQFRTRVITNPLTLGFGPPVSDPDHEVEAGITPPTRLSSFWALFGAAVLSFIDFATGYIVYPALFGFQIPWYVESLISFVSWFVIIQSVLSVLRFNDITDGMMPYAEPAPAMMLSHMSKIPDSKIVFRNSLLWGLIPFFITAVIGLSAGAPFYIWLPIGLVGLTSVWLYRISWKLTKIYRAEWDARNDRRVFWEGTYLFKGNKTPIFIAEGVSPTPQEFADDLELMLENDEDADLPEYEELTKFAAFRYAPNCHYDDYVGDEDRIKGALDASMISIIPIGSLDEEGIEKVGDIGNMGFRVMWSTVDVQKSRDMMFEKDTNPTFLDLCLRYFVLDKLGNMIGQEPLLRACDFITRKSSPMQILELELSLREGQTISQMYNSIANLQVETLLGWIRFYSLDSDPRNVVHMLLAEQDPDTVERMSYVAPPMTMRSLIASANWQYYFAVTGIVGGALYEPPKLEGPVKSATPLVQEMNFVLPEGMTPDVVRNSQKQLTSASSRQFIEINTPKSLDTSKMSAVESLQANSKHARTLTLLSARTDPLNRMFPFIEYKDRLIKGRVEGTESLVWSPGILSNDMPAIDDFDAGDAPHLLLAGMSGSGKTVALQNFIVQMMANNSPNDARFHLGEPKIGLQKFRNADVVVEFVDSWSPNAEFFENMCEMSENAVRLMVEKNRILAENPSKSGVMAEKLSISRSIARREGTTAGQQHPLMLPYDFFVIEECATVFADAPAQYRELQLRIIANYARVCREGRSSGVFLITTTQYPTNASIPSIIRQQQRRIGMRCQNSLASNVVIEENGLESIRIKGAGKIMSDNGEYRLFRGYMTEVNDGTRDNMKDDINDILATLPSNNPAYKSAFVLPGDVVREKTTTKGGKKKIILPGVADSLTLQYNEEDSMQHEFQDRFGSDLLQKVSSGKKTRDIPNSDRAYEELQKKYGMGMK